MNLSQSRMVVVVLAVLLLVAAGLLVSTTQETSTQLGQAREGRQGGVPASVAVLPGLAAAGVAAVAIVANNRQERTRQDHERQLARDRQEHERQLKTEELEDQRRSRLRDERRQAYSEFFASWHSYEDARMRKVRDQEEFVRANLAYQRSFNALSLIAPPEVRAPAKAMRREEVQGVRQNPDGAPRRFMQAARRDLGIPD